MDVSLIAFIKEEVVYYRGQPVQAEPITDGGWRQSQSLRKQPKGV